MCTVHFILFRALRALTNIGQRITLTDLEEFFAAHRSLFFPPGLLRTFLEIEMENRLFIHVEGQIKEMNFSINLTVFEKPFLRRKTGRQCASGNVQLCPTLRSGNGGISTRSRRYGRNSGAFCDGNISKGSSYPMSPRV